MLPCVHRKTNPCPRILQERIRISRQGMNSSPQRIGQVLGELEI